MKTTVCGYDVKIFTKVDDATNRLTAEAVVPDLDSMTIRVSGPMITGRLSQADEDSIVLKVLKKTVAEFRRMAAMAIGMEDAS